MRKVLVIGFIFLLCQNLNAQKLWLLGVEGGWNFNNVAFSSTIPVEAEGSLNIGVLVSYLPGDKKPGLKFALDRTEIAFSEIIDGKKSTYRQNGIGFHFLSHLFLRIKNTKAFIDAGPGIYYLTNTNEVEQTNSLLPAFVESNINKAHILLTGGAGLTQQIGKLHVSVFSTFSFDTSRIFPKMNGLSNSLILRFGGSLQVPLNAGGN